MRTLLRNYMVRLLLVVMGAVGVQLAVWVAEALEERRTPPPVKAARAFVSALNEAALRKHGACERALSVVAATSRSALEAQVPRGKDWQAENPCWALSAHSFRGLRRGTAQLSSQTTSHAIVSIERHEADPNSFLIPGFWPTRWTVTPTEMRLVEEGGTWKVVAP